MPFRDFYRGCPSNRAASTWRSSRNVWPAPSPPSRPGRAASAAGAAPARRRRTWRRSSRVSLPRRAARAGPLTVESGAFTIGGLPAWTHARRTRGSRRRCRVAGGGRSARPSRGSLPGAPGRAHRRPRGGRRGDGASGRRFYQHYGLWYDRRRVDHNYYGSPEQRTGDVWAPFMELPWARSGQGKAWDGLSKYDLHALQPVVLRSDEGVRRHRRPHGALILYHHFYFQHWLLESRSHYVDFPWRPVNTIQDTGPARRGAGGERVLRPQPPAAPRSASPLHPPRARRARAATRTSCTASTASTPGPLEFVRFWLDTVAEWQTERGKTVFVSLEIPKDQMDAILRTRAGRLISGHRRPRVALSAGRQAVRDPRGASIARRANSVPTSPRRRN